MQYDPHRPHAPAPPGAFWTLEPSTDRVEYPAWWKAELGYAAHDEPDSTRTWRDRVHPDDLPGMLGALHAHLGGWTPVYEHHFRLRDATGQFRLVRSTGRVVLRHGDGTPLRMTGTMTRLATAAPRPAVLAPEEAASGLLIDSDLVGLLTEQHGRLTWANQAAVQWLRHRREALVGMPTHRLFPDPAAHATFTARFDSARHLGRSARLQTALRRGDGTTLWADIACSQHPHAPDTLVWRLIDISDAHALQARFAHQALHDPLTGLPNRRLLADRLATALAGRQRDGSLLALCYIDLDGFKQVNDTLGHDAGDRMLRRVAGGMGACIRPHDTLARVGGDEFVLLLTGLATPGTAQQLLERLQLAIADSSRLDNGPPTQLSASIGVALCPDDGDTGEALLALADQRMFVAKRHGRRGIQTSSS